MRSLANKESKNMMKCVRIYFSADLRFSINDYYFCYILSLLTECYVIICKLNVVFCITTAQNWNIKDKRRVSIWKTFLWMKIEAGCLFLYVDDAIDQITFTHYTPTIAFNWSWKFFFLKGYSQKFKPSLT